MDPYKSSLIRRLKFKSKEVLSELKDAKDLYNDAVGDFCIAVDFYCSTMEIDNPLESIAKNIKEEEKEELNNNFKKLVESSKFCSDENTIVSDDYKITKEQNIGIIPPIGGG